MLLMGSWNIVQKLTGPHKVRRLGEQSPQPCSRLSPKTTVTTSCHLCPGSQGPKQDPSDWGRGGAGEAPRFLPDLCSQALLSWDPGLSATHTGLLPSPSQVPRREPTWKGNTVTAVVLFCLCRPGSAFLTRKALNPA